MAIYIKYQGFFNDCDNSHKYRVDIYGTITGTTPSPIRLTLGSNPLTIEENDSDDFFTPIRTQTGTLNVCTELPDGGLLDLADILPKTNTSTPVQVLQYSSGAWRAIWSGFLSCEVYDQAYIGIPENISLNIISLLESWKYYHLKNAQVISVIDLISQMKNQTYALFKFTNFHWPADGDIKLNMLNTSIFIEKKEYVNEESHTYTIEGKSFYEVLETICTFMGWTARESNTDLYFELMQGFGLSGTSTMNMSALSWRGTGHRRSSRIGKRVAAISAKLAKMDVNISIPEIPYGSFDYETYYQSSEPTIWVYFLPSSDTTAYSNISFNFYKGECLMGFNYEYSFHHLSGTPTVDDMIMRSIAYARTQSDAYEAFMEWEDYYTEILAGACYARMQIGEDDPRHSNTTDGLYLCIFPGSYQEHTVYNNPIVEMRSVQAFAAMHNGYFNLQGAFWLFKADASFPTHTDPQIKLMYDLQVGNMVWTGSDWRPRSQYAEHFFIPFDWDLSKCEIPSDWNSGMDIDEVSGLCIPTFYDDNGLTKQVMGEVILRIYPDTAFHNRIMDNDNWRGFMTFNIFVEKLDLKYIPVKSAKLSDRGSNDYRRSITEQYDEDIDASTDLASWLNNNPSPSLIYEDDGVTPMQHLIYYKADGETTEIRRPEVDLLDRMEEYYQQARTILKLDVEHLDNQPLPLLRITGYDGKTYAPVAESRDFGTKESTLTCLEAPPRTIRTRTYR